MGGRRVRVKTKGFIKSLALGGGKGFVESLTLLSQRLNARGGEGFEFARPGGEYGFSSLVKQNKKGKNCAVFCFAGKRKIFFIYL